MVRGNAPRRTKAWRMRCSRDGSTVAAAAGSSPSYTAFGGLRVDDAVEAALHTVMQPAAIQAAEEVATQASPNATKPGSRWSATSRQSHYRIPAYRSVEDRVETWLKLTNAASAVGVSP